MSKPKIDTEREDFKNTYSEPAHVPTHPVNDPTVKARKEAREARAARRKRKEERRKAK